MNLSDLIIYLIEMCVQMSLHPPSVCRKLVRVLVSGPQQSGALGLTGCKSDVGIHTTRT